MLEVIACRNCNAETHHLDAVTVQVQLERSTHCSHCLQSKQQEHALFFCSPKCMVTWFRNHEEEFLKEVARFRAGRLWDAGFDPPADSGENLPVRDFTEN